MYEKRVILTRHEESERSGDGATHFLYETAQRPRTIHNKLSAGEKAVADGSGSFSRLGFIRMTGFSGRETVEIV